METWKRIFLNREKTAYEVSDLGNVRRADEGKNTFIGRKLNLHEDKDGYHRVCLTHKQKYLSYGVNRLVLSAFVGRRSNMQAHHKNYDKKDNSLENLKWLSPFRNNSDAWKHGKKHWMVIYRENNKEIPIRRGEQHHATKTTTKEVLFIKRSRKPTKELSARFGVNCSTIIKMRANKTWKHLTEGKPSFELEEAL